MEIHGRQDLNRALLSRAVRRFNQGDLEGFLGLFHRSLRVHGLPADTRGAGWLRDLMYDLKDALPDARVELCYTVSAGERLALRAILRGTFRYPFHGAAPTGTILEIETATMVELSSGLVTAVWSDWPELARRAAAGEPLAGPPEPAVRFGVASQSPAF